MTSKTKIQAIQGWRFIFALFVVAAHLHLTGDYTLSAAAVSFFLVLSGFLAAHSNTSNIGSFYSKKFWNFYPIHWFALTLLAPMYFILSKYQTVDFVLRYLFNATLLQAFIPPSFSWSLSGGPTLNGPSWFLAVLLLFFFLLPFIQKIRQRSRKLFYGLVILWCAVGVIFPYLVPNSEWYVYFFPPIRMTECLLGLCLADISLSKKPMGTKSEFFVVGLLLLALISSAHISWVITSTYLWIPVVSLVVWVFSQSQGLISKVLATKYMVWLGGISFEIYIFHWVMKRFVISIEQLLQIEFSTLIFAFLVLLLTFIIAISYHYWFEPHIINKLRKINN